MLMRFGNSRARAFCTRRPLGAEKSLLERGGGYKNYGLFFSILDEGVKDSFVVIL